MSPGAISIRSAPIASAHERAVSSIFSSTSATTRACGSVARSLATNRRPMNPGKPVMKCVRVMVRHHAAMTPIDRLLGLPGDLANGLQQLPVMAATLSHMTALLDKVAGDTRALPALRKDMGKVGEATAILAPMDARMANIEKTM